MNHSPVTADAFVSSFLGAARAVAVRLDAALRPLGLSLAKVAILHQLAEAGEPLPLCALAERRGCGRSNITQLVDRLEQDGFVRRRDDDADRRSVRAQLTSPGERVYDRALRILSDEQQAIIGALGGDAAHLRDALESLAAAGQREKD